MVTPQVYPTEAAAAGCTASYSVMETVPPEHTSLYDYDGGYYYRLNATAVAGWRFSHFEWTWEECEDGVARTTHNRTASESPYPAAGSSRSSDLYEYTMRYIGGGYYAVWTAQITYCRAVFVAETYGDITVETSADPAAGGTTAPVTETHQYSGSASTTFTLVATPNNGWRFVNWKLNGAVVATTNTTTVTHTFTSYAQTFHYVATFRRTGLILHGVGGAILHGSNGTILHSG